MDIPRKKEMVIEQKAKILSKGAQTSGGKLGMLKYSECGNW